MKNAPKGVLPHIVTTSLEHPSIVEPLKYELEQNNIGMFQRISKPLYRGIVKLNFSRDSFSNSKNFRVNRNISRSKNRENRFKVRCGCSKV